MDERLRAVAFGEGGVLASKETTKATGATRVTKKMATRFSFFRVDTWSIKIYPSLTLAVELISASYTLLSNSVHLGR